jgi:thiamine-phosphate pyrophosphorylase
MLPEMTPAVERALDAARRHARAEGAAEVTALHLVHGLLAEPEGRAWEVTRAAGLDEKAYRESLPSLPGGEEAEGLPLHPAVEQGVWDGRVIAREYMGDATVSGEAVLLALVRRDEGVREGLERFGLTVERLEGLFRASQGPALELEEPLDLLDLSERIDSGRMLDAAANRAREGLRVVEDYCRFSLDDAFLTRTLKEMRHALTEALAGLPPELLLQARETQGDVGTAVTAGGEARRHSLPGVAQANLKRLQEALRSLEEVAKLHSPDLARALERLRYQSYTVERAVLLGATARRRLEDARLYVLLSGETCAAALDWTITEAAAGGVRMVQLREKTLGDRELWRRARDVRRWTEKVGVLFILNDRPDLARLVGADGVHLGQDDLPVKEARRILGPDALIGVSTHDLGQLRQAILDGASYVGVGPTFPSGTKRFEELAGLEYVRAAMSETTLPAFAIGGIEPGNIGQVIEAGARRVAVGRAISSAEDPRAVAAALRGAL